MKVLILHHNPLPAADAASTRIEFLSEFFKRKGHEVAIIGAFSYKTLDKAGVRMSRGVRIFNISLVFGWRDIFSLAFNIISSSVASFLFLALLRPDIVMISLPNGGYGVGSFMIAKLFKKKIVIDYRDEWEDYSIKAAQSKITKNVYKFLKKLMTICYSNSNLLIAVTERMGEGLRNRGLANVKIIPNGADTNIFRPRDKAECRRKIGVADDEFILAYSGGVGGYYRLDIVLYALKKFVDNCVTKTRLIIVGHGTNLLSVLRLADDLGLKDNVTYLGKTLDKFKLVDMLCASDVGIVPYDSNPLWRNSVPVKSLEYFACGLPVVATAYRDSVLGKMITENKLGAVTEPEDVHMLYESIRAMKTNTELRNNLMIRGPVFIKQNYDRYELASEFYSLVLQCLEKQK